MSPKDPTSTCADPSRSGARAPTLEEIWSKLEGADEQRIQTRTTLREALERRVEFGRRQMMEAVLCGLLTRRLGREPNLTELHALKKRADALKTEQDLEVLRQVSALEGDALLSWLLDACPASRR